MQTIQLGTHRMVVPDEAGMRVLDLASRAARSSFPVLVCGESGTGKEIVARYIHQKSTRAPRPFVSVNCAAIPENLLEAELFGFERGAFTGAIAQRIGKFELASGATLLLDEISEMQLALQAKLLRALQEGEVDRIGGRMPVPVDTRIIATSNRDPEAMVKKGVFREDLFFRLNVIRITCPPLRERMEAILTLGLAFLCECAERSGAKTPEITSGARDRLIAHDWPGNVRELKNAIERAYFLSNGKALRADHLDGLSKNLRNVFVNMREGTLASIEKEHILSVLAIEHGNRTHAAQRLGISVRTLRNKLKLYQE
jgi:transcriptional regulator with PAS, ATPase and Fis domain